MKYVDEKFPPEVPQMFWLHPNAEIGFLTNQGLNVFNTIMKVPVVGTRIVGLALLRHMHYSTTHDSMSMWVCSITLI